MQPYASSILITDDDADARRIARTMLEAAGRRVFEARDGRECLRVAALEQPDVIVLDLVLPDVDGWEAARALKADPLTANIPILAFTAIAFDVLQERALQAGCDLVLTKPVMPRHLLREIDALYAEAEERRPRPFLLR
jgi:CheY-like chemotaxis protein